MKKDLKKAAEWFKKAASQDDNVIKLLEEAAKKGGRDGKDAKEILKEISK